VPLTIYYSPLTSPPKVRGSRPLLYCNHGGGHTHVNRIHELDLRTTLTPNRSRERATGSFFHLQPPTRLPPLASGLPPPPLLISSTLRPCPPPASHPWSRRCPHRPATPPPTTGLPPSLKPFYTRSSSPVPPLFQP
jgi:hypothetical protein